MILLAILQTKALIKCWWVLTSWSLHEGFLNSCAAQTRTRPISTQEKFLRTDNFPKILLKVENFQLQFFFQTENLCRPITSYKIFFLRKIFLSGKILNQLKIGEKDKACRWEAYMCQGKQPSTCSIIQLHAVHVKYLSISLWQFQGGTGCVVLWRVIKSNILCTI